MNTKSICPIRKSYESLNGLETPTRISSIALQGTVLNRKGRVLPTDATKSVQLIGNGLWIRSPSVHGGRLACAVKQVSGQAGIR
jgi:hypothetical protein